MKSGLSSYLSMDNQMKCICQEITELEGNDADEYAKNHLKEISVDVENWQVTYECPVIGLKWLKDFPHSELHGGGSPRLRKLS